jgi:hypothetical protein
VDAAHAVAYRNAERLWNLPLANQNKIASTPIPAFPFFNRRLEVKPSGFGQKRASAHPTILASTGIWLRAYQSTA